MAVSANTKATGSEQKEFLGTVALDKDPNSREILVYPHELLPFTTGEVEAVEVENQVNTKGQLGSTSTSVKTVNYIKAIYKDDTPNRANPPDVRRGEKVILYNYGDSNVWYWKSEGKDDNERRLETQRFDISGSREYNADKTDDNTYFLEMDSLRSKKIKMSTSDADGEAHRYTFNIDAGNSTVTLGDESGNQMEVFSEQSRTCFKNDKNSILELNDKNIFLSCEGNISINAKTGSVAIVAGKESADGGEADAGGNVRIDAERKFSVECKDNYELKTHKEAKQEVESNYTTTIKGNQCIAVEGFAVYLSKQVTMISAQHITLC